LLVLGNEEILSFGLGRGGVIYIWRGEGQPMRAGRPNGSPTSPTLDYSGKRGAALCLATIRCLYHFLIVRNRAGGILNAGLRKTCLRHF